MKKLIILTIFYLFISSVAYSSVYILYDKNTDEVLSISGRDDAVMKNSDVKKVKIKDVSIKDLALEYDAQDYVYRNRALVVNMQKINADALVIKDYEDKISEQEMVKNRALKDACLALEKDGIVFTKIKCTDF